MRKKAFLLALVMTACVLAVSLAGCSHSHEWSAAWRWDSTHHWHECEGKKCDEITGKAEHTLVNKYDDKQHWQECSVCGYATDKAAHSFKEDKCEVCNFVKGTASLVYTLNSDGSSYAVVGAINDSEVQMDKIVIAEYYNGKPVTVIGKSAFAGFSNMKSVSLPRTIIRIEESAFSNCTSLSEIVIPKSVEYIASNVFNDCNGILIKAETDKAGSNWHTSDWGVDQFSSYPVVWDCLNNNVADDGYTYFDYDGLRYGVKDGEAILAKQVAMSGEAYIRPMVKYNDKDFAVTKIADYAFIYSNISSVRIPYSVKEIGNMAFFSSARLRSIVWQSVASSRLQTIGISAFGSCSALEAVVIPSGVTKIDASAFSGCVALTEAYIPQSVAIINNDAFEQCNENLVISCEAPSKPKGWSDKWNVSNHTVNWGV